MGVLLGVSSEIQNDLNSCQFKMIGALAVVSASVERSFSCLKR